MTEEIGDANSTPEQASVPGTAPANIISRIETRAKRNVLKMAGTLIAGFFGLIEPLKKMAINVGVLVAIVFGGPAIYRQATKPTFVIKDISVPSGLEDRGFSGDVLAQEILDQISIIDSIAGSKKEKADISGFDLESTMPDIDLPVGGLNLAAIVAELRQLLGYPETKITGEAYIAVPGNDDKGIPAQYALRLRIAGQGPVFRTATPNADIQSLIEAAAQQIMRKYDPVNLGYYYYRQKDFGRAYEITELALADDSSNNDPWAYTMRGLIARDEGHFDDAAANMREAINRAPNFWLGYVNLAGLLRLDGKLDEAEAAARKAIELASDQQEGHSALALILMDRGDKEAALAEMQKGVAVDPKDPGGHLELGRLLAKLNRFDEAVTSFKTSASLNSSAEPLIQAADASRSLKRGADVLTFLRQATDAEPKNPSVWLALGEAEIDAKDIRHADQAFAKAIELDGAMPTSIIAAAKAFAGQKRFADADALYKKNAKAFDKNADFLLGWSELLWTEDKKSDAEAKLKEAIADAPDVPATLEAAGRILEARGEINDAIEAYKKAITIDPRVEEILRPHIEQLAARTPAKIAGRSTGQSANNH